MMKRMLKVVIKRQNKVQ